MSFSVQKRPFLNNDGSPTAAATKVMDLHTIDTKLNLGQYPVKKRQPSFPSTFFPIYVSWIFKKCADRCLEDLDLIFDNCYRSSKNGSEQWREAKKLESFYIHSLKQMPLQEVEVEDAKGNKGEGKTWTGFFSLFCLYFFPVPLNHHQTTLFLFPPNICMW